MVIKVTRSGGWNVRYLCVHERSSEGPGTLVQ